MRKEGHINYILFGSTRLSLYKIVGRDASDLGPLGAGLALTLLVLLLGGGRGGSVHHLRLLVF